MLKENQNTFERFVVLTLCMMRLIRFAETFDGKIVQLILKKQG